MTIEQEIRNNFKELGAELARKDFFGSNKFESLSQYGYSLMSNFNTKEEAEKYTIDFYSKRIHLIRQMNLSDSD